MPIRLTKVVVTGGRDNYDIDAVKRTLDELQGEYGQLFIIEGGATGIDECARCWAHDEGQQYATVPALWHIDGSRAGPMRNAAMIGTLQPDIVVHFDGGRGTANCLAEARQFGAVIVYGC